MSTPTKDDYLKRIGEICVSFARLEVYLSQYIGDFISSDIELNRTIIAGESFNVLLTLFESLIHYRVKNSRTLKRFEDLISRLIVINSERNRIVHSSWFFGQFHRRFIAKRTLLNKRKYKRLIFDIEMPRITSLRKLARQIDREIKRTILLMEHTRPAILRHRKKTENKMFIDVYTKQRVLWERKISKARARRSH
jgi:hypothetical protein